MGGADGPRSISHLGRGARPGREQQVTGGPRIRVYSYLDVERESGAEYRLTAPGENGAQSDFTDKRFI